MKPVIFALVAASAVFASTVLSQDGKPGSEKKSAPPAIGASEADKYLQKNVVVTGKVAQVTFREKLVFLNLDKRFPNSPLTCVIFARSTNQFGDLKALNGKQVEVNGKVEEYNNKPQIVLNSTNQLKVVEGDAAHK